jgi:glycosyltransferase involved in cell wall biosynthesis
VRKRSQAFSAKVSQAIGEITSTKKHGQYFTNMPEKNSSDWDMKKMTHGFSMANMRQRVQVNFRVANIMLDGRLAGPQNQIIQVAQRLKKHGIETIVFIPNRDSQIFYSNLIEKNICVRRLNLHHLTKHMPHLIACILHFLPELFSLYRNIQREDVTLVHCNNGWQIKGVIAGKMAGAKVIWHLQDSCMPPTIKILFKVLAQLLCDGLIVSGSKVKHHYFGSRELAGEKIAEIQAPVDTSYFDPDRVSRDYTISNDSRITITTMGYINPVKGIEYFIEMARILNRKYRNLNFYVVGPNLDSQKHYSRKLAQLIGKYRLKNLHFSANYPSILGVLEGTDIYVCSSVTEASPMSVWEAMAMKKAIVSTDVGDVKRFIKNGENGFIVQPRNAEGLAEKVGILIENKELRNHFGKHGRAVAVRELDAEICAEKHRNFYLEVLGVNKLSNA